MSGPSILLLGAGGHARACIDVIEQHGQFTIGGLLGLAADAGTSVLGYPVIGLDDDVNAVAGNYAYGLVTVGQIKSADVRIRLFDAMARAGLEAPVIVSPRAYVSPHANIGAGTIVMHGAVVNAAAVVGRNCIINSQALVEHDVVVGDHCHIATSAAVNGGVRVGEGTFIGSGTTIRQGITIGAGSVIGMGQWVIADCAPGTTMPASSGWS